MEGHTVLVLPRGIEFQAEDGQSVFQAARDNGIEWPTRCFGRASCRQCYFETVGDAEGLSSPSRIEAEALKRIVPAPERGGQMRLACQARVHADVVLWKIGVHQPASDNPSESREPEESAP